MPRKSSSLNRQFRYFTFIMLSMIAIFLGWYLLRKAHPPKESDIETSFSMYPGYGIPLPDGYLLHGIDVSRYQKRVNWPMVKRMEDRGIKLSFAFIKATEGADLVDPQFRRNWRKSREARIIRGAYHFFRFGIPPERQAKLFIETVNLLPGDLPPVLDVEVYNGTNTEALQQSVATWLALVEQHYKVKPILYTNAGFYNMRLQPRFDGYLLWVAHYYERRQPRVNRQWQFWQHNESGRVSGIDAFVDFNVFNGDSTTLRQLLVQ